MMDSFAEELLPTLKKIADQSGSTQTYRSNIEDLLKLYRNIYQTAPNNEKFTRINIEKARNKLWSKAPAMEEFMLKTGWMTENGWIKFSDEKNLRATIELLAGERTHVIPSDKEWIAETKVENITKSAEREERLRKEAAKKRDAELAACLEDKEQRRLLNETIKQNIRADWESRRKMNEASPPQEKILPLRPRDVSPRTPKQS